MSERKTIYKVFFVWDFEKEEQWLNTMAMSGWILDKVGFCRYEFVPCQPGEYTVRLAMHERDEAYISFIQETGAEYIDRIMSWHYYRYKTELGSFSIFSDIDSKIKHLNVIAKLLSIIGTANLVIGIVNSMHPVHLGWINLLCATLLMYALGRIHGKKEALEKDRLLLE
ncbi:MAG: DUF2812 domain-containing protein [Oscillospiraceae bacterium]|nr:DUF2812 domain-containing protein [Oscillospiraceae bacterium]